jgi:hypothetical protein
MLDLTVFTIRTMEGVKDNIYPMTDVMRRNFYTFDVPDPVAIDENIPKVVAVIMFFPKRFQNASP